MPKRKRIKGYNTAEVQGKDSFVKFRRPSWKEQKDLNDQRAALAVKKKAGETIAPEEELSATQMILERLVEWNWVDDDGNEMPLPETADELDDMLTDIEMLCLARIFGGDADQVKSKN